MATDIILTLDFGRYNSVVCWYVPCTPVAKFRSIQTPPEEACSVLTRDRVSIVVIQDCLQAG